MRSEGEWQRLGEGDRQGIRYGEGEGEVMRVAVRVTVGYDKNKGEEVSKGQRQRQK
jgi:hypothetical protein